jgi:hypothetical protein
MSRSSKLIPSDTDKERATVTIETYLSSSTRSVYVVYPTTERRSMIYYDVLGNELRAYDGTFNHDNMKPVRHSLPYLQLLSGIVENH